MYVVTANGERKELDNIGWGSRHYDKKENKVSTALSIDSIKKYENQQISLEIENITIWSDTGKDKLETVWPVSFTLDKSYISNVEEKHPFYIGSLHLFISVGFNLLLLKSIGYHFNVFSLLKVIVTKSYWGL